jgi:hypothetical protein
MKRTILFVMAVLLVAAPLAAKSRSSAAFEQLSTLVGQWKGVQDGVDVTLTYTLTANDSTLMEEFRPSTGPVMLTMFTVDGDRLLATHYCAAKNQPQMATAPIVDSASKALAFSLVRVTGMTTPEDWHNTGLEMVLEDKDHLTQNWTWAYKGKSGKSTFHYTRK